MQLYIGTNRRIGDVQQEFNSLYPFLKIDFLKNKASKNRLQKTEKVQPQELMKLVVNMKGPDKINISKQKTVSELKKDFKELFGLTAEVFRKSGNLWIETSLTDDWTLEQQNSEGELISSNKSSTS